MDRGLRPGRDLAATSSPPTDDALEGVSILLADPEGEGVGDVLESLAASLGRERRRRTAGHRRGTGRGVPRGRVPVRLVRRRRRDRASVEFGDDTAPVVEDVTAATRELVTIVAGNLAELG